MGAINSDAIRGFNDIIILYHLLDKDSYGYEISRQIEALTHGSYLIKETTLYSAFSRLERNGYVAPYLGAESFGKQRTYYTLTQAGREYYQEKCQEWLKVKAVIDSFIRGAESQQEQ